MTPKGNVRGELCTECYLGTNIVLHDLDLLGETLLGQEVAHKVLGGGLALVTGDRGLGDSHSSN